MPRASGGAAEILGRRPQGYVAARFTPAAGGELAPADGGETPGPGAVACKDYSVKYRPHPESYQMNSDFVMY